MSDNFEREIPKSRISISVDLHTGGARQRVELPLKLLVLGDYSAGHASDSLAERKRIDVNKNNFDAVLSELNPKIRVDLPNALEGDNAESSVALNFKSMQDFEPESVAHQIPQLQRLISMRNLLRDLKSNFLDNSAFASELERIVKSASLSTSLSADLRQARRTGEQ
jgi:type VI secretion system protein ImpB